MKGIFEKPTANFIIMKYCKCFPKFGNKRGYLLSGLKNEEKYYIHESGHLVFSIYPLFPPIFVDPVKP